MPTYSYACTECDNRFDIVQAFTDDTLTTCQQCTGRLRKLFNSVGVVFKGSGFYRTDSRESAKSSTVGAADSTAGEKKNATDKKNTGETASSGEAKSTGETKASTETKSTGEKSKATSGTTAA